MDPDARPRALARIGEERLDQQRRAVLFEKFSVAREDDVLHAHVQHALGRLRRRLRERIELHVQRRPHSSFTTSRSSSTTCFGGFTTTVPFHDENATARNVPCFAASPTPVYASIASACERAATRCTCSHTPKLPIVGNAFGDTEGNTSEKWS